MATIKQIDGRTIHQIQSGQVIVDLCSVVKELVENSVDAGASNVDVRFRNQGLDVIEIQDNGNGISPANYASLALKHHTSKLSSYADIGSLETFGFRGEALASLCALSTVTVTTCLPTDAPKGSKLTFDSSGRLDSTSVVAAQKGTTVSVEKLFHNLPVRRRELARNIKREWLKVISLLNQYACIQVNTKFSVTQQPTKGKKILLFSTKGNPTTRENIINIFGAKTMSALIPLDLNLEMRPSTLSPELQRTTSTSDISREVRILGHVSRPAHGEGRQAPDRQMFFINGRPCGLPQFSKAFNDVYKSYNATQSPFVFADIQLDTHMYDVNVSPDKRTILLHDQQHLLDSLRTALAEAFDSHEYSIPSAQLQESGSTTQNRIAHAKLRQGASQHIDAAIPLLSTREALSDSDEQPPDGEASQVSNDSEDSIASIDSVTRRDPASTGLLDRWIKKRTREKSVDTDLGLQETGARSKAPKRRLASTSVCPDPSVQNMDKISSIKLSHSHSLNDINNRRVHRFSREKSVVIEIGDASVAEDDGSNIRGSGQSPSSPASNENQNSDDIKQSSSEDGRGIDTEISDTSAPFKRSIEGRRLEATDPADNVKLYSQSSEIQNTHVRDVEAGDSEEDDSSSAPVSPASGLPTSEDEPRYNAVENTGGSPRPRTPFLQPGTRRKDTTLPLVQQMMLHEGSLQKMLESGLDHKSKRTQPTPSETPIEEISTADAESKLSLVISKSDFGTMRIVGQFNLGFIMAIRSSNDDREGDPGDADELFIIDQHASDEKYNFERLQATTVVQSQRLVNPKRLELTVVDEEIIMHNIKAIEANGFKVEVNTDGERQVGSRCLLTAVPLSRETTFDISDLEELISLLTDESSESTHIPRPSKVRKMFAMRACRSSVMVGKPLTTRQMYKLVGHMGDLDKPWNCPHGRPTMRHLCCMNNWDGRSWHNDVSDETPPSQWMAYANEVLFERRREQ